MYVGGVLVLMLFAVMVVHRSQGGRPCLEIRHDIGAAAIAIGVAGDARPVAARVGRWVAPEGGTAGASIAEELLGNSIVVFELAGGLLLIGLVAVLVIVGSGDRR